MLHPSPRQMRPLGEQFGCYARWLALWATLLRLLALCPHQSPEALRWLLRRPAWVDEALCGLPARALPRSRLLAQLRLRQELDAYALCCAEPTNGLLRLGCEVPSALFALFPSLAVLSERDCPWLGESERLPRRAIRCHGEQFLLPPGFGAEDLLRAVRFVESRSGERCDWEALLRRCKLLFPGECGSVERLLRRFSAR